MTHRIECRNYCGQALDQLADPGASTEGWTEIVEVRTLAESIAGNDLDWETHVGLCPDCSRAPELAGGDLFPRSGAATARKD